MMITDLDVAVRRSGLPVVEQAGWERRGHGQMSGVRTILCHHTAGPRNGEAPSLGVVQNGRTGLPGPLSQLVLGRSGTVYVVAAGLAYHAGNTWTVSQSNSYAIGIEAEATGVDPWPEVQYRAYVRLVRALIDHYGLSVEDVLGHKEAAKPRGRKIDPNFDMDRFRRDVEALDPDDDPKPPPESKVEPVLLHEKLLPGANYVRMPAMVGKASALYGKAWVSISAEGGGDMTVAFQRNAASDGPPPGAGPMWGKTTYRNASRVWHPVPDGTEYIEAWISVKGKGGFVAIEFDPK